jgi:hypothetical protein
MTNQNNNGGQVGDRRLLPFFVEFVKFSTGFLVIIAFALLALSATSAMMAQQ